MKQNYKTKVILKYFENKKQEDMILIKIK